MKTYAILFHSGNNTDLANVDANSEEQAIRIYQGQYPDDIIIECYCVEE